MRSLLTALLSTLCLALPATAPAFHSAGARLAVELADFGIHDRGAAIPVSSGRHSSHRDGHHDGHRHRDWDRHRHWGIGWGIGWRGGVRVYGGRPYRGWYPGPYRYAWYPPAYVVPYALEDPYEDQPVARCREVRRYQTTATIDGQPVQLHGLMCLGEDDKWRPLHDG